MVNMVVMSPVYGLDTAKLYVDPPSIIDTTMTAGTDFTVNINIKDVNDLFGYTLKLFYNTTLLDVNTVTVGSFFPSPQMIYHNETNEESGYVWYCVLMPLGSQVGRSGNGILLTINFNVTSTGDTNLDLDAQEVFNSEMKEMARNVGDGYFSNILRPTKLYVEPKNTINQSLTPGENFTINVNILAVTDLFGYEFFLNYTTDILTATNITLGSFFSSEPTLPVIWHEEINDTLGYVWYNATMPLGAPGKPGSGTLAAINFTVDSIGETTLDLCNTRLVNSEGERIEYDTLDGYFNNKLIVHDIAVTDITTTVTTVEVEDGIPVPVSRPVSEVYVGERVNVTVFVENNGTISETFNVTAYYDNNIIGTPQNVTLSGDFGTSLVFEWNTEGVEVGSYTIRAEASPVLGEEYTDNNIFIMEDVFNVLSGQSNPLALVVAAAAIVFIIAVTAVYFIKFRKPKP